MSSPNDEQDRSDAASEGIDDAEPQAAEGAEAEVANQVETTAPAAEAEADGATPGTQEVAPATEAPGESVPGSDAEATESATETPETPAPESAAPEVAAPESAAPEAAASEPPAPEAATPTEPATPAEAAAPAELDAGGGQHAAPRPRPPSVTRISTAESIAAAEAGLTTSADIPPGGAEPTEPGAETPQAGAEATTAGPDATQVLEPEAQPTAGDTAAMPVTEVGTAAGAAAVAAADTDGAPAVTRRERREPVDLPEPPPRPGVGRHLLAVLVGLLLTPIGMVLTAVGIGAYHAYDAELEVPVSIDATNLSMLLVGAVILVVVVLLGLWSPAVPLTGGLLVGVGLGVLYLGWPTVVETFLDNAYATRPSSLDQLVSQLDNGTWLVIGLLITAGGLVAGMARRRGRLFGQHTALATSARIEAARAEETRRQLADAEEAALAERARSIQ